jgi:hypothetical protein
MQAFQILSRREQHAMLAVGCVAGLAVMAAALLPFLADGHTPWFDASSELALAAKRCDVTTSSSRRHECLRELAPAATQRASSPIQLALH